MDSLWNKMAEWITKANITPNLPGAPDLDFQSLMRAHCSTVTPIPGLVALEVTFPSQSSRFIAFNNLMKGNEAF